MNFLDSLMENMRTKGVSAQRISFMDVSMDESSRKLISKSLSKVGKSKQVLNKQNENRLKAVYKLGLLFSKKVRTLTFNVFVTIQEFSKHIKCQPKITDQSQNTEIQNPFIETNPIYQNIKQKLSNTQNQQLNQQSNIELNVNQKYLKLSKMFQCISLVKQKQYSFSHKQYGLTAIINTYLSSLKISSSIDILNNIIFNHQLNHKLQVIDLFKQNNKLIDKLELFISMINVVFRKQKELIKQSFQDLQQYSQFKQQKQKQKQKQKQEQEQEQKQDNTKQITQDYSLLSIKSHLKQLQRQTPVLQLKITKDQILEIDTDKSLGKNKYHLNRQLKSPSISGIEQETSFSSTVLSNIFNDKTSKESKVLVPLKIKSSEELVFLPKQQERFALMLRIYQHTPQQLHKLYPNEISTPIHDTTQPFGLFSSITREAFKQHNKGFSKPKSQIDFNQIKKQKIISLKNSFIQPSKKYQTSFGISARKSKIFNLCESRKSFGLKSSRRIKQSCVGQDWQRVELSKIMKTQSFSPKKQGQKEMPIKPIASTSRSKCINSISIVKSELFSRIQCQNSKSVNQAKRITSICSQFINRLSKS